MTFRLAFIGAGRMASAMVKGVLARKDFAPKEIVCTCGDDSTGPTLAQAVGIHYQPDVRLMVASADVVVMACKPQQLSQLDPDVAQCAAGTLILSILAGTPLAKLKAHFPKARNFVRAMPNTPGQIGAGVTAYCTARPLAAADTATVQKILRALGEVLALPEIQMDAVTAVSGSGPAYFFEFTAALRESAVRLGLSGETAHRLALETALGAARLMKATGADPETLRANVTSPGGTTAAALDVFKRHDLRGAVQAAVTAAKERSQKLSELG